MREEIGSYEATTKFLEILRRVEAWEAFTITNRGKPVAEVIPSRSSNKARAETAITNILKAKSPKSRTYSLMNLRKVVVNNRILRRGLLGNAHVLSDSNAPASPSPRERGA